MTEINKFTPIGLGTWMMESRPEDSVRALRAGIEAGSNHIDTAEMYGSGRVEEIVGKAVHGMRDKVSLVSKVLPSNAGAKATAQACERSLRLLKTDYLDVYLLHWRTKSTPLGETFEAFEKLKAEGKIRAWGVSNFDVTDLDEAVRLVGEPSIQDGRLVCNQVYYSLQERTVEAHVLPWCRSKKIPLVAYSPLDQGSPASHAALSEVAQELGGTPAQVALAYLIRNKDVIAIPKSSDVGRTVENVRAQAVRLTPHHIRHLDQAFPLKFRPTLPTV